jgi:hypothetical protein
MWDAHAAERPPRSHSVVARLQFSNRIRDSSQSMPRFGIQKPSTTKSRKGGGLRMSCFRTRGTFESAPDDAQSPGEWYAVCAPTAGGLVRLVLRVLDWYTSCSSLNLPSAEYAGNTVRNRESGNPSLAGSYDSVISLIDAGQRSGYAESNACLRGITSPTSRSESSFGYVLVRWRLTGAGAVAAEPPKTSQSRRGAAVEPTLECESRKTSV